MKMWQYRPFLVSESGEKINFKHDICLREFGTRHELFVIGQPTCQINCGADPAYLSFIYRHDGILSIRTILIPGLGFMPDCRSILISTVLQNRDAIAHLEGESRIHEALSKLV